MLEQFLKYDRDLLVYLNNFGSNNWDFLWLTITDKLTFLPFFLIIIYFIYKKFTTKELLFILLTIALLILFTDQFTNLIKDSFQRLRPCRDDTLNFLLRSIDVRCGKFGFFSAHAANSMAVSIFLFKLFQDLNFKALNYFLIFWVVLFSYSRIYLGVHFPIDIIMGLLVGLFFGNMAYKLVNRFVLFRTK